ncbi:Lipid A palmitoyltransferase PagP [Klebsiella pneumoniae]|nr:Lipid A palmitoyltransferase PagP [Klebsiella pneumoniae]
MSGNASASFSSTLSEGYHTLSNNVAQTWNEPEHYDLYVPAITWHARFAYDKEKTDKYNERPWGQVSASRAGTRKGTGMACT